MLLQVHDELVFDVLKSEKDDFEKMVKTEMEKAFDIRLPLLVDIGFGTNWLEAH
jgi:DNA polymerase-1